MGQDLNKNNVINDHPLLGLAGFAANARKSLGSALSGDRDKGEIGTRVYGVHLGDLLILFLWVFLINALLDVRLRNAGR